jgi:hypothetical protein
LVAQTAVVAVCGPSLLQVHKGVKERRRRRLERRTADLKIEGSRYRLLYVPGNLRQKGGLRIWQAGSAELSRPAGLLCGSSFAITSRRVEKQLRATGAYNGKRRSRSAFEITETELKVMAALAIKGLKSNPKNG